MFCPLKQMEFSTRSVQLHSNPNRLPGVPPRSSGAREEKRGGMARIVAMAGISVETGETEKNHTTAHMVR